MTEASQSLKNKYFLLKTMNKIKKMKMEIVIAILIGSVVGTIVLAKPFFNTNGFNDKTKYVQNEIIVKFKGNKNLFQTIKVSEGKVLDEIKKYRERFDVEYVEPNYIAHTMLVPNDPVYSHQWHLDNPVSGGIKMEQAWDLSTGAGATVAVIDTGIRKGTDLANTCFVTGYDYVNKDNDPTDDNGHGTHVAGTIAQSTNNGIGVAGVAYKSCLMPVKVLNATGSGTYANVALGIRYAADKGAKVINLSLGGSSSSITLEQALAYAYEKGVTIVAAAGNDNLSTLSYPAAYDAYVIAVGATRYDETRSYYSNYGPSLDLVAPGGDLNVDQNNDGYGDGILQQTFVLRNNVITWGYYFFQGTSMATPHVSGVVTLLISKNNTITPDQIKIILQNTAKDLGTPGRDDIYGYGLVNAFAALQSIAESPNTKDTETPVITNATGNTNSTTGEPATISATITDNVDVDSAVAYYTPIDSVKTSILMTKNAVNVWSANVPVALNKVGTIPYYITAKDAANNIATSESYFITVTDNDSPIANAGPDQSVKLNSTVTLNGSKSSDNIGIVNYKWDFNALNGVNWDAPDATGVNATTIYPSAGIYTVSMQVSDNAGLTAVDTAIIKVTQLQRKTR